MTYREFGGSNTVTSSASIYKYGTYTTQGSCTSGLKNYKEECFPSCGSKSGSCAFCGTGKCCRNGYTPAGDCAATDGISSTGHYCVPS